MTTVTVTEKALREMVREAMFNPAFSGWSSNEEGPVDVDPITDPSQPVTEPINPNFTPQTKTEFGVAVNQLVKNLPDTQMPELFDAVKTAIDQKEEPDASEDEMKKDKIVAAGGTGVEEQVRRAIRSQLAALNPRWDATHTLVEAPPKKLGPVVGDLPPVKKIPAGQHGAEYLRRAEKYHSDLKKTLGSVDPDAVEREPDLPDDHEEPTSAGTNEPASAEPTPAAPTKRGNYKDTAIGGMDDVGGKSFEEIARALSDDLKAEAEAEIADAEAHGDEEDIAAAQGMKTTAAVSGAKRIADEALKKAQFLHKMDPDDLEMLVFSTINDYVKYLAKSGELAAADVQLMRDHPSIMRDLDGFREFLHNSIRRSRRGGQKVDTFGEEGAPSSEEVADAAESAEAAAGAEPAAALPAAEKRAKDTYKVYPFKGKRSVVRVGNKLYGTGENGAVGDGATTQFKSGDRAKIARDGDKLKVSKTDSDHSQTWDPVEEGKRPVLYLKEVSNGSVAAKVAARKKERPDLYCKNCQWMTGGGQCPRHGGPPWSAERQRAANAKSRGEV